MCIRPKIKNMIALSVGIALLNRGLFAIGQSQKSAWKGKIVAQNGLKVIKNPAEPLHGEFACQLEENLSLGGNLNNDNYYFPRGVTTLNIDGDGNIYITDFGNTRIQMYDKRGSFIHSLGRKGQGPGEFQMPHQVSFDSNGNPWVFDPPLAIHQFDKEGKFQKKIALKIFLQDYYINPQGNIFGTTRSVRPEPGGPKESVVRLDTEGNLIQTVAEFRGELTKSQNAIVWHQYSSQLYFSSIDLMTFCYGFSVDYRIFIADGDGKIILVIEKDEKPQTVSGKEKVWIKEKSPIIFQQRTQDAKPREEMVFPEHRPYFDGIIADDRGRVFVKRLKSVLDKDPESAFDVFSTDGFYLYKMKFHFKPVVIKAGFAYEIRENKETGDFRIVRHIIKNWDKIVDGIL